MLLTSLKIPKARFEQETGWQLKPEGACKGDVCIPLNPAPRGDTLDIEALANSIGMPLIKAEGRDLWALGPESIGSRALTSAKAPNMTLPDLNGNAFELSSQLGKKVLVYAWAPY